VEVNKEILNLRTEIYGKNYVTLRIGIQDLSENSKAVFTSNFNGHCCYHTGKGVECIDSIVGVLCLVRVITQRTEVSVFTYRIFIFKQLTFSRF
jgi:hypothetical protein